MFIPSHLKVASPYCRRSFCQDKHWAKELNDRAFPGEALNLTKVRPVTIESHPIRQLNRFFREMVTRNEVAAMKVALSETDTFAKVRVLTNTLHIAARAGSLEMTKVLIENGACVNERYGNIKAEWLYQDLIKEDYNENKGPSPLMFAAMHQKHEVAKILIEHQADVNQVADLLNVDDPEFKFYSHVVPLHYAAANCDYEMLSLLLNNKADPNIQNGYGESPLLTAVWKGHTQGVKLLMMHGADPKQINQWGVPMTGFTTNFEIEKLLTRE